ncbi:putative DNA repair/transcription protein [Talaromyces proteolyticus]|uniref:MMS19 nucleotide excision repair protein n=1 Tax=Talaromyces proteolyticus TaxID=1131652 RepID=A0AAD4KI61_9EURO|nr:putative DNA repair/transcription protein [Talaromyces proteolyticus]KAH8692191.1 putative DNA repair/transcription protein [Talaromyces proteolyticus]
MSALQTFMLVVDHDKQEAFEIAAKTAQDVENKQITLIDVVQSLGEYVNEEDAILRGKAVSYLAAVVKELSPKFLSRQQIQVLTTFFCDRIEDGGSVTGLDTLQKLDRFSKELTQDTARALFESLRELQARAQSQRYQVYQLLNGLMENHRAALHEMGDESLVGIVDLMTGEKDPRNLMLVFSILKVVMTEWDLTSHVETLFESVYNYFPITFKPPPKDPYGITAQDLKDRLQDCISSNSLFAPHAFPALLDKLDSTSNNVKRDSLNALSACIKSYDSNTVSRYSIKIWDTLKFEILNSQEEFLSEMSLEILQEILKRLSDQVTEVSEDIPLAHFLKPIIKECNEQLREPQNKQAKPARDIVRAVSSASKASFVLIIQSVVSPLFTLYQEADSIAKQRAFLETYVALLDSALEIYGTWAGRDPVSPPLDNPLSAFQDQFTEVFSQALMGTAKEETSFRQTALQGLLRLSKLRNFFQDNEIGLFVQYLDEILLKEEPVGSGELKKDAISALAELSRHKSKVIMDLTLPAFMATLPDQDDGKEMKYLSTLDTLAQISTERDIFETLVRRLLNKFDFLLQADSSSPVYAKAIILTIIYAMEKRSDDLSQNLEAYYDRVVVGLSRRVAAAATSDTSTILRDVTVLDSLGRLCNLIVRSIPRGKQDEVAENIYTLFCQSDINTDEFQAIPFNPARSKGQLRTIILSTYLLAGLPKDTSNLIPYFNNTDEAPLPLLNEFVQLSISGTSDPAIQLTIHRHLALLINKFLPNSSLVPVSDIITSLLPSDLANAKLSPKTIKTVFWLSKALILRLAPSTSSVLTNLLSLLSSPDETTRNTAARGFSIILSPDDVLSAQNGANIRLLSKQRVFSIVLPLISAKIREASTTTTDTNMKPAYLTALSGVLSAIPPSLVLPELPTLLPLLLQSLDLAPLTPSANLVKEATLKTLAILIRDNGVDVIDQSGHISELVHRLLKTSSYQQQQQHQRQPSSPILREQALRCLYLLAVTQAPPISTSSDVDAALAAATSRPTGSTLPKSKLSPLLPVKNVVLRSLMPILDDPKRDVRKAAVDARGAWLRAVSDENEDEDD